LFQLNNFKGINDVLKKTVIEEVPVGTKMTQEISHGCARFKLDKIAQYELLVLVPLRNI